jgi:hypothetical protein
MAKAALAAIDKVAESEQLAGALAERIRAEFADQVKLDIPGAEPAHVGRDPARQLRRAAISAERRELIRIWRDNQISDEVLHELEEELDYQESRA